MSLTFHSNKIFITSFNISSQIFSRYFNKIKSFLHKNLPENYTSQLLQQNLIKIQYQQSQNQSYKNFTQKIKQHPSNIGICLSSTGIIESSSFNQIKGIRAALVHSQYISKMCRQHNNANICIISTDCIAEQLAANLVYTYLINQFDNQVKNKMRLKLMQEFEEKYQTNLYK